LTSLKNFRGSCTLSQLFANFLVFCTLFYIFLSPYYKLSLRFAIFLNCLRTSWTFAQFLKSLKTLWHVCTLFTFLHTLLHFCTLYQQLFPSFVALQQNHFQCRCSKNHMNLFRFSKILYKYKVLNLILFKNVAFLKTIPKFLDIVLRVV